MKTNKMLNGFSKLILSSLLFYVSAVGAVPEQVCINSAPATTPAEDFIDHNDGTVTHLPTGLMWKVCAQGQAWDSGTCSGAASDHTWQQALQSPQTLNSSGGYAGYTDWRLPNIKELKSIVELKCYAPAINQEVFDNTPSDNFWSSTPYPDGPGYYAGYVYFHDGQDASFYRSYEYPVRLVRNVIENYEGFVVTQNAYPEDVSNNLACKGEFGNDYRLADWNDIVDYYNTSGDMTEFFAELAIDPVTTNLNVSLNGNEIYSGDRHYFIARHDHNTPSYFLVHEHIDNHLIDLGSWYEDRKALCYKPD